jgi:hypothetical protein
VYAIKDAELVVLAAPRAARRPPKGRRPQLLTGKRGGVVWRGTRESRSGFDMPWPIRSSRRCGAAHRAGGFDSFAVQMSDAGGCALAAVDRLASAVVHAERRAREESS